MKYMVRYEVEGFVEKEYFKNKYQAIKYRNEIIDKLWDYLLDIQIIKL